MRYVIHHWCIILMYADIHIFPILLCGTNNNHKNPKNFKTLLQYVLLIGVSHGIELHAGVSVVRE